MLGFPHPVAEAVIPQLSARALPVDREVVVVRRLVELPVLEEAVQVATATPVAREAATPPEQIRAVAAGAELVRLAARRLEALPPLPVRVEQAARQSSTGQRTRAEVVAALVNLPMR